MSNRKTNQTPSILPKEKKISIYSVALNKNVKQSDKRNMDKYSELSREDLLLIIERLINEVADLKSQLVYAKIEI